MSYFCTNCGLELENEVNFCPNCGNAMGQSASGNQNTDQSSGWLSKMMGAAVGVSILKNLTRGSRCTHHHGPMHRPPRRGPGFFGRGPGRRGPGGRGPGGFGGRW